MTQHPSQSCLKCGAPAHPDADRDYPLCPAHYTEGESAEDATARILSKLDLLDQQFKRLLGEHEQIIQQLKQDVATIQDQLKGW